MMRQRNSRRRCNGWSRTIAGCVTSTLPVGAIVSAMEWCDKTGADESIVNDIADFLRLWTVTHD